VPYALVSKTRSQADMKTQTQQNKD